MAIGVHSTRIGASEGDVIMEHLSEIVITVIAFAALIGQWVMDLRAMPNGSRPTTPVK